MVIRQKSYFEGQKNSNDKIIDQGMSLRTEKDCSTAYNNMALHPWVNNIHVAVYMLMYLYLYEHNVHVDLMNHQRR